MHRNRTWQLDPTELRTQRNRILPIEGGDGSTLTLDFTTGVLDPRLSFTRGSDATFVNSQGLVQYADANYLARSETFDGSPWTLNGVSQTPSSITNPVGGSSSRLIEVTATGGSKSLIGGMSVAAGFQYTFRIWVRAGASSSANIGYFTGGGFLNITMTKVSGPGTISTATGATALQITGLTTDWTQVQVVLATVASAVSGSWFIYPNTIVNSVGDSVYLWGAQANIGATSNPYYSTTTPAYFAPRFDYDPTTLAPRGLLVEGTAVNVAALGTGSSSNTSFTVYNTGFGPTYYEPLTLVPGIDGSNTSAAGFTLSANGFLDARFGLLSTGISTFSVTSGQPYTASFYYKATRGGNPLAFNTRLVRAGTTIESPTTSVDLPGPNGFTRRVVTFTASDPVYGVACVYGSNFQAGDSFHFTGMQVELGSGASSYIPTGASQGTRNADNVVATIANVTGFNANQGTMFQSWQDSGAQDPTTVQEWAFAFGLTSAAGFGLYVSNAVSGTFGVFAGSSNTGDAGAAGTYVINGINKAAVSINVTTAPNTGTISLSANGSAAVSGTRLDGYNQAQTLSLGQRNSNQRYLNGWIRQFKYWPYILPNAQLQSLTT